MDCVLWTGSLAQLYKASWEALLNCLVAIDLYEKWVGLVLERGQESSLSPTPPLPQQCRTDEEMLMTTGHPWRGKKTDISLQSVLWSVCTEITSSYITKIELFYKLEYWIWRLPAKCKKAEKKNTKKELSLSIMTSSQSHKNKANLFCLVLEGAKSSCAATPHQ